MLFIVYKILFAHSWRCEFVAHETYPVLNLQVYLFLFLFTFFQNTWFGKQITFAVYIASYQKLKKIFKSQYLPVFTWLKVPYHSLHDCIYLIYLFPNNLQCSLNVLPEACSNKMNYSAALNNIKNNQHRNIYEISWNKISMFQFIFLKCISIIVHLLLQWNTLNCFFTDVWSILFSFSNFQGTTGT